jgi:uridine kinase
MTPRQAAKPAAAAIRRAVEWLLMNRSDMTFPSASIYSASVADAAGDIAKAAPPADRAAGPQSRLVIGVAGGSGSGKTTVVRRIVDALGPDCVSILDHDRYYRDRPDLRLEDRTALNYDHPDSLETDLMVRHVAELKAGHAIEAPLYDFARYGRRGATETVEPRRAIIVEGILIFADAALRAQMDIKVFVDTDDDTRFIRRLKRDVAERGRTMDSVIEQYLGTVKPMHLEFVQPSKRYADVIIPQGGHNPVAIEMLLTLIRSSV